jgi:hypothetical protein
MREVESGGRGEDGGRGGRGGVSGAAFLRKIWSRRGRRKREGEGGLGNRWRMRKDIGIVVGAW